MIKLIKNENIVMPFINSLNEDKCFSSPMLKSEEEIKHNLIKRIKHLDDLVLAIYDNELIIGVFSILIEKEEKYMEILLALSKEAKAYNELFTYLEENFRNWKCDIVCNPKITF